jgi:hypothetical protein
MGNIAAEFNQLKAEIIALRKSSFQFCKETREIIPLSGCADLVRQSRQRTFCRINGELARSNRAKSALPATPRESPAAKRL